MAIDLKKAQQGDIIAEFSPPPSRAEDLARYALASGDSNPLHLDPAFARQAGFSDLVVHGMLSMAQLGRLLTERFPVEKIRSFSTRFEGVVLVGQQVNYRAWLLERTPDGIALALDGRLGGGERVISGYALVAAG